MSYKIATKDIVMVPNKQKHTVMRDYECANCGDFSVIHTDDESRQLLCAWCGCFVREKTENYEICKSCGKFVSILTSNKGKKFCQMCSAEQEQS